jgi:hypothetical protein
MLADIITRASLDDTNEKSNEKTVITYYECLTYEILCKRDLTFTIVFKLMPTYDCYESEIRQETYLT